MRSFLIVAVAGLAGCARLPAAWVRLGPADVGERSAPLSRRWRGGRQVDP